MTMSADLGQLTANTGKYTDCWAPRCSPSRVRRRERRATERVAVAAFGKVAAEKDAPEKVVADKAAAEKFALGEVVAEKVAAEEKVALEVAAEKATTEEVVAEKIAAKKATAEKVAAEIGQVKVDAEVDASSLTCDVAVTSCLGSQLATQGNCWNCGGAVTSDHQCGMSPVKAESVKLASSLNLPPVLKSRQRPSPSAPIVLKKPVRMLDGSPAFPPRQKGKNS